MKRSGTTTNELLTDSFEVLEGTGGTIISRYECVWEKKKTELYTGSKQPQFYNNNQV